MELQVEVEAVMRHQPDPNKPVPVPIYLPLLETYAQECPDDPRAWAYLCRERSFHGQHQPVIDAATKVVELAGGWPAEKAAACRLAAGAATGLGRDFEAQAWFTRGTVEAPEETEAWGGLCHWFHTHSDWSNLLVAAEAGLTCPQATHYLTDQNLRAWGMPDYAALAAHHLDMPDAAVQCGYAAWSANQLDGRLLNNLREYVKSLGVPTYAVIPKVVGERDGMTSVLVEQLSAQGVGCFVNDDEGSITHKWNATLDRIDRAVDGDRWNVLVINNDVTVGDDFVTIMCAALRSSPDIGAASPANAASEQFTGWCHLMRGEQGRRYDGQFLWWYSDTDMRHQIEGQGQRVVACPAPAQHLHPNEATFASPELVAVARADEARYAAKWGVNPSTLFLARNPDWGLQTVPQ